MHEDDRTEEEKMLDYAAYMDQFEEPPSRCNDDPEFVAEREERRQLGIAAKAMRVLPIYVRFGRRGDNRQRFNAERRNRNC